MYHLISSRPGLPKPSSWRILKQIWKAMAIKHLLFANHLSPNSKCPRTWHSGPPEMVVDESPKSDRNWLTGPLEIVFYELLERGFFLLFYLECGTWGCCVSYCCWGTMCLLTEMKTLPFYTNVTKRNIFLVFKIRQLYKTGCWLTWIKKFSGQPVPNPGVKNQE